MGSIVNDIPLSHGDVVPAKPLGFDILNSEPSPAMRAEQFQQAVEETLSRANDQAATILTRLDSIERAILWLAKQPWEREFKDWSELMAAVDVGPAKQQKFREEVVTGPLPVRDLL